MRRFFIILLCIPLLIVILGYLAFNFFLDEEKILQLTSEALEEQSGAKLRVDGGAELSFFPQVGVKLLDANLELDANQDIQARSIVVGVELVPLFSGRVEVEQLIVDGMLMTIRSASEEKPEVDTKQLSDEQLDAFYAERRKRLDDAARKAGAQEVAAAPLALNVGILSVTDSTIELVDTTTDSTTRIDISSFRATGLNLDNREIPLELEVSLDSGDGSAIHLSAAGQVRIDQHSQLITLNPLKLEVTGATPEPVQLETTGELDWVKQSAELALKLTIGPTIGNGQLRYANFESPQIDTNLHLNLLDPAVLVLAGPEAAAEAGDADMGEGATGDEPLPLDPLRALDSHMQLAIDEAVFGGQTIESMKIELRAVDGVITLKPMSGRLHGGDINFSAVLDAKHNTARLNTSGGVTGLDIAQALASVEATPLATGTAQLTWEITGAGRTQNELMAALLGPIRFDTEEVTLNDVGVEQMFCQAVALVNQESLSQKLPENSRLDKLSADLNLSDGKLILDPLRAELTGISLSGKGNVDLLSQNFETTFAAQLSPALSQFDEACRVNERLIGINWPVDCAGDLSGEPGDWCKVDTGDIITEMATKEVKRKVEKEASKLMKKLFK